MPRRRGRKRRLDVSREPNGQPQREPARERAEDARLVVIAKRMELYAVDRETASNPLTGTAAGRLLLRGVIVREELEALQRYDQLRATYIRALHGPFMPAPAFEREPKGHDETERDFERLATEEWQRVAKVLASAHPLAHKAIADVAYRDVDLAEMTPAFRCGLDCLVALWRLAPRCGMEDVKNAL